MSLESREGKIMDCALVLLIFTVYMFAFLFLLGMWRVAPFRS